ncbi:MAG: FadR family transcriptional regulator [Boseongicola sp. SB0673_bin_14]|nr:FadR family transcriptional regulator [Boseongicola sp. SB0667_bin_21]MYI68264.1 FadR family transcriptional regulator [Boseongicola sp. SB0673_bin_14]
MPSAADRDNEPIVVRLAEITSPRAAMMARLWLEPELAGHASIHAAPRHLTEARRIANGMRTAANWAEREQLDLRLDELIAVTSGSPLLAELHRIMNAVRDLVVLSSLEIPQDRPSPDRHSFAEHDEIIAALERRDRWAVHAAMREHLKHRTHDASEGRLTRD